MGVRGFIARRASPRRPGAFVRPVSAALLASAALFRIGPAEAACTNNTPANNEVVNCSGANTIGVIAPASTGVQLNLLTGGSIIPTAGTSVSLGATADVNLQSGTTTGNPAIANTYAVQIGNGSTVDIDGTIQSQGGVSGPGGAGFSNAHIDLSQTGLITTNGTGNNSALKGTGGGNTYQIDGEIHATGTSGQGISVGNNDVVTIGATGKITTDAGDTSTAIDGSSATGVKVTTAAGSVITTNGLGFLGAIHLGDSADVELSGTVNSKGSAVANFSTILGGVSVGANSTVWLKEGGQILVASAPPVGGSGLSAAPGITTLSATGITNSTITVDGTIENALGSGISVHTGDNVTVGSTGRITVSSTSAFSNVIGAAPNTTTTDNLLTISIAGRVENTGPGKGIFISASSNDATDTSLHANVTIQEGGVLAVQNNVAYSQDNGQGSFPAVVDNLIIKGTVSRSTPGTVIDLNDGADTITIFPTATIVGNIKGGNNSDHLAETDTFILDGAANTTGTFDFNANQVTQFEAFTKQGDGHWILTGNVTFSNSATITGGLLSVNGTLTAPVVTVGVAGTLGGTGTIVASTGVTVNGTIAPGNSIGTLNITGPYTQATGSTYTPEVNTAGQSDLINITGAATIQSGATVSVIVAPGLYTVGQRFTILTASTGVTGQFTTLTDNAPFVDFSLDKDTNNIYLDVQISAVAFTDVAQTRNQLAAASGLQSLGPGNRVFDAVLMLDVPNALRAFDLLSGEIHATVTGMLLDESRFPRDAVLGRLRQAMGGASIFAPQFAALNFADDGEGGEALGYAGARRRDAAGGIERALVTKAPAATTGRLITTWGQVFGDWGHGNSDGNAAAYRRSAGGFITGIDTTLSDTRSGLWRFGFAGGYRHTSLNVDDRTSSGGVTSYDLAGYAGTQRGPLGMRLGVAYSWNDIGTSRSIVFPGFADATSAKYRAHTAQVFGEVGYSVFYRTVAFEPFAALAHVDVRTDRFTEGGGAAALAGVGNNADTTFSTLGLRTATALPWANMAGLVAKSSLGWKHAFGTVTPTAELAFASGGTPFVVAGTPIARDAAAVELAVEGQIAANITVSIGYNGQLASHSNDNGINANLVRRF